MHRQGNSPRIFGKGRGLLYQDYFNAINRIKGIAEIVHLSYLSRLNIS
jgi:hypothetical protein